jgi:hypothetical protein
MRVLYILYVLDLFHIFLTKFGCLQSIHVFVYYIHVYMYVFMYVCE